MKESCSSSEFRALQLQLALVILALAMLGGTLACGRQSTKARVVLITLDTLRYDSFAEVDGSGSTIFDRFYTSTASIQPSHASMFTGLHPRSRSR